MDVLMDNMASCEMDSLMNGSSGYNQVNMCPSDAEKTFSHYYWQFLLCRYALWAQKCWGYLSKSHGGNFS
ncbi:hypothetical protein SLE2022_333280 [Rubroshorea leprosula]